MTLEVWWPWNACNPLDSLGYVHFCFEILQPFSKLFNEMPVEEDLFSFEFCLCRGRWVRFVANSEVKVLSINEIPPSHGPETCSGSAEARQTYTPHPALWFSQSGSASPWVSSFMTLLFLALDHSPLFSLVLRVLEWQSFLCLFRQVFFLIHIQLF